MGPMKPLRSAIVAVAVLLLVGAPSAPTAAAQPNYLANCLGVPEKKPATIVFACADYNMRAIGLKWSGWGGYYAYGSGRMEMNDCTPYCAAGHFQPYTISIIAFGTQQCPNGETAYKGVRYTYQRIYHVAPWTVAGHTYTTKLGPLQSATSLFPCEPRA
jgi:hypothetical protein